MSNTTERPIDFDAATLISERYDVARALYWVTIQYQGLHGTYEIQGYANGEKASCDCPAGLRRGKCKHASALPEFVAAIARAEVKHLPTHELTARLAAYQATPVLTYRERVGLGAVRDVLARRGVRLAPAAVVARGKAAVSDLFDDAQGA